MKILIVDDDQSAAVMLGEALEARGHTILCRFDPVSGIAALGTFQPDLLFLDVDMPVGGGAPVYQTVRKNPLLGNLPVAVVTGTTAPAMVWDKLGAAPHPRTQVYSKPVDLAAILRWVDGLKP